MSGQLVILLGCIAKIVACSIGLAGEVESAYVVYLLADALEHFAELRLVS